MTSVPLRASRRTSLLCCFALCTFWPVDAWTQGAPVSRDLDPVVVTSPAPPAATKRRGGDKRAASSARSRRQRAAVATAAAPAPSPAASAAPTLNLTGPASSGSRLNLTRLQTPASVEVITAETIAERGQHNVLGAINVISKMPLTTPRNEGEISLDTNLTRRLAVDSGGPINKDVSYRVTAIGNMSDGWVDRDKTSNVAVSAAVRVQASDTLAWTLSTDYGDRGPLRYFGTPLVNGRLDESLRFKNYNVNDSNIRYRDSWNQLKTEWDVTDAISIHNVVYYLNSQRHWKDVESYAWNPVTGLIDRKSYIEIFHNQQQTGDRMDATFHGHVLGMMNEFVAGFDVNRIDFAHTNNSPFSGASSVNPVNFDPGLFLSPIATVPSFSSVTNQYALFAEDRLSVTDQFSLVGGVRQDQPAIARTDLITPANG